jgi:DNA-binding Lrp family transcriptional regulator
MSVLSFVFIECEQAQSLAVAEELKKIGGVEQAYQVTGNWDVIAIVRASNVRVLGDVLIKKIQKVPGVLKTVTNIVID